MKLGHGCLFYASNWRVSPFALPLSLSLSCTATRAIIDAPADNARLTPHPPSASPLPLVRTRAPVQQRTRRARYRPSLQRGLPGLQCLGSKAPVRATHCEGEASFRRVIADSSRSRWAPVQVLRPEEQARAPDLVHGRRRGELCSNLQQV